MQEFKTDAGYTAIETGYGYILAAPNGSHIVALYTNEILYTKANPLLKFLRTHMHLKELDQINKLIKMINEHEAK